MPDVAVIEVYEAVLSVTEEMLHAARRGDWDQLVERERACRTLVDWLRENADSVTLPPSAQARKIEIVRKVLADDAEIRNLTEPQLARLGKMLEGTRREQEVRSAYNASG